MILALSILLATFAGSTTPAPSRPKLVVVITVDQLRPDYLNRWKTQLTGGLAQLVSEGAVFTERYKDHAITETAPAHSTNLSRLWPATTGVLCTYQCEQ